MIKAVLFDFGQTLVDSSRGFRTAEKQAQRQLHTILRGVDWDAFIKRYRITRRAFHEQSEFSRLALWQAVIEEWQGTPDLGTLKHWEKEYWSTVRHNTVVFPEAVNVLQELRTAYRIGLITNTQGQAHESRHRSADFPELMGLFEVIVVAGEGDIAAKPNPQPFEVCLERLRVSAEEAVYVGDDYHIDVCGAAAIGMHPVWLKHRDVQRNWPSVETTVPVIESLNDLLRLAELLPG